MTVTTLPKLPLWAYLAALLPIATPAIGQENATRDRREQPELLWHQASALFPIRVHLPENYDSTQAYPAVVALHGYRGSSEGFERIGDVFAEAGFIAILPEGPYPVPFPDTVRHSSWELSTWTEQYGLGTPLADDPVIESQSASITVLEFIPSVIDRIQKRYRVGPLYIFGFSLGGAYALLGGFYNWDQFGAAIAFGTCCVASEWFTHGGGRLEDGSDLPVRLAVGRSDPGVPVSDVERARDLLKGTGYDVILDVFEGGHIVQEEALRDAVKWLNELADRQ